MTSDSAPDPAGDRSVAVTATRPPTEATAAQYRRLGYWSAPRPRSAEHRELRSGADRTALVDNRGGWSYRHLADVVASTCARMSAAGIGPGDAVLIVAPLSNAAVAAYLAATNHGCVAVLLDRRCGASDLRHAHAATRPRLTLARAHDAESLRLREYGPVLTLEEISTVSAGAEIDDPTLLDFDAAAVVMFTSGTTGTPKGVVHSRNTLRCGSANMAEALRFGADDIPFLSTPLASITGVVQLHMTLSAHATLILEDAFDPVSSAARVREHGATVIGGAPVILEQLFAEYERQGLRGLPLRSIAVGGTAIPHHLIDTAVRRYGIEPIRVYGSTEVPFSTCSPVHRDAAATESDEGMPLRGVDIAIRDDVDHELLVRGPHRFLGYLDPDHNTDTFDGEWVRTGDQARITAGRLAITGRLKEIVARKGMKISLGEIDAATAVLRDIGECVAYGVPDPETGERLVLALRCSAPTAPELAEITGRLRQSGLAKWKLPEQVVLWDEPFPRTESGKIQRKEVAARAAGRPTLLTPRLRDPERA
ncbi:class I adenylate-forming enzyme family protein [Nocardia bovistercoris]|uniref:AMP-binding protein n=1 Tax=Nocardia bovistercoris TaxID=2785916 RepID=A0A931I5L5_9NOCA|nr:fatty acid--CoA ligase family protein [Nocardia bovistercoris]MBH0775289.1 AMP-binding protein [Nocardia bovistercoris]